tara:strand:+ start:878 stop:1279 length:402 start_codon:yes stop_codon:yes gene_type:complete
MALPTSGIISGSQIAAELGLTGLTGTNLSLGGMIESSSLSNTDPDKYSEFYGYADLTFFLASSIQSGTKFICTQSRNQSRYYDGTGALPAVGDIVYTNSGGTTVLLSGYSRAGSGYFLTNSSGVVTNLYFCIK